MFMRTEDDPDWKRVLTEVSRMEACMVAVPGRPEIYYGGGITNRRSGYVFEFFNTIEKIDFPSGFPESMESNIIAPRLSQARAEPGCAVIGNEQKHIIFAGGRFYGKSQQEPSDAVDILDVDAHTIETSLLSHKAVGVSIASVSSLVFVTGGAPSYGPPTSGVVQSQFDYGAYDNLGVDRYDMDAKEWQVGGNMIFCCLKK